ncbi:sulfatase-like hydrolase/transferase [candidate division KSB1 bacterium]
MNRHDFIKTLCLGVASIAMPSCRSGISGSKKKPNVLLIITDDQRFDTLHALGNQHIITPHMDSLVHNGTTFTNAYIMGGTSPAICAPSRAMMLTGRTLFHVDKQGYWQYDIEENNITLPETFKNLGYRTFGTGKWHNGQAAYARGFSDGNKIFFGGMSDHYRVPFCDFDPTGQYPKGEELSAFRKRVDAGEKGTHSSELFSNAAIRFLREYESDDPFFMYVSYTAPHDPRIMPKKYRDMYDPDKVPFPENFLARHPFDNGNLDGRDEMLAPHPRTPETVREHIADYFAIITHLDSQIGRLLAALDETGKTNNTIIVFCGDNGLAVGHHGLMGKQSIYEHSVHVPLIMSGPGIPKGEQRDSFCYLLDLFPTLCDLTGSKTPGTVEGLSLLPVINNPRHKIRETLFFAYMDFQRGVRDERYKLMEYSVNGERTTQLFDLKSDPWEINNLSGNPDYAEQQMRLRTELLRRKDKLGDGNAFWKGYD